MNGRTMKNLMPNAEERGPWMSKTKKWIVALLLVISTIVAVQEVIKTARMYLEEYPSNDINAYVAWGAGGATDIMGRTLSIYAAKELGVDIVVQNKTGASGAIATEFVRKQPADGYNILYNAENPTLYKVLNISPIDYSEYEPIILIGQQMPVVVVGEHSPYHSISELIESARKHPGKIKLSTTGIGALPGNVAAMLESTSDVTFNQVPFGGDADALTAVMGGHTDVSVINYSAAVDYAREGKIRILTVLNNERLASEPNVETISEVYPEYGKYFPWGPFIGAFVDKDCPEKVKETLAKAFRNAWETPEFQQFLADSDVIPLGYSGDEARAYIEKWQQVTAWILHDVGQTTVSPAEYGIQRIE